MHLQKQWFVFGQSTSYKLLLNSSSTPESVPTNGVWWSIKFDETTILRAPINFWQTKSHSQNNCVRQTSLPTASAESKQISLLKTACGSISKLGVSVPRSISIFESVGSNREWKSGTKFQPDSVNLEPKSQKIGHRCLYMYITVGNRRIAAKLTRANWIPF